MWFKNIASGTPVQTCEGNFTGRRAMKIRDHKANTKYKKMDDAERECCLNCGKFYCEEEFQVSASRIRCQKVIAAREKARLE